MTPGASESRNVALPVLQRAYATLLPGLGRVLRRETRNGGRASPAAVFVFP